LGFSRDRAKRGKQKIEYAEYIPSSRVYD